MIRFLLGWVPSLSITLLWGALDPPNTWTTSGILLVAVMSTWFAGFAYRASFDKP